MASLLIGAGILSYESIKKSRAKRAEKKAFDNTRFTALEAENAARITHLQQSSPCFCQRSDWRGGGCEVHGYVPAAGEVGGPPAYNHDEAGRGGTGGYSGEDTNGNTDGEREGGVDGRLEARGRPPGPMGEEEVRRINEERRKRMRAGGFTNWVLRRKGKGGEGGDGVVR